MYSRVFVHSIIILLVGFVVSESNSQQSDDPILYVSDEDRISTLVIGEQSERSLPIPELTEGTQLETDESLDLAIWCSCYSPKGRIFVSKIDGQNSQVIFDAQDRVELDTTFLQLTDIDYDSLEQMIYWGEYQVEDGIAKTSIKRRSLVDSEVTDLFRVEGYLERIEVDPTTQMIYWSRKDEGDLQVTIRRSSYDGLTDDFIINSSRSPIREFGIFDNFVVDPIHQEIYWEGPSGNIFRREIEGDVTQVVRSDETDDSIGDFVVDRENNFMYWHNRSDGNLFRIDMETLLVELIAANTGRNYDLALGQQSGDLYVVQRGILRKFRANGEDLGVLFYGLYDESLDGFILDQESEKIYFIHPGNSDELFQKGDFAGVFNSGMIMEFDLRSEQLSVVFDNVLNDSDIVYDEDNRTIYWGNGSGIQSYLLGSDHVEQVAIFGAEVSGLNRLAIDFDAGKMYWAYRGSILKANVDGSEIEIILSGLTLIGDIDVSPSTGQIYWHDVRKIGRANLDGTNTETMLEIKNSFPGALTIDHEAGMVYYSISTLGTGESAIQRADLDFTFVEDVFEDAFVETIVLGN